MALSGKPNNYIPVDPGSSVGVRLSSFKKSSMISATAELRSSLARRLAIATALLSQLRTIIYNASSVSLLDNNVACSMNRA